ASDLLTTMAEVVGRRHFGSVIRLEIDSAMPARIRDILLFNLDLEPYQVYTTSGPIGFTDSGDLRKLDRADLKYPPFLPLVAPGLAAGRSVFDVVAKRDVVLYHP